MCGCGNSVDFLDATDKPLGACDIACPGNAAETCGGTTSYNLYEINDDDDDESEREFCERGGE